MQLTWSRVVERRLVGYHVYRRCEYGACWGLNYYPTSDVQECETSWSRLTNGPVPEPARVFNDLSVGSQQGCFDYAVRPVGPDGVEGPISTILSAALIYGTNAYYYNPQVDELEGDWPDNAADYSEPCTWNHNCPDGNSFNSRLDADWWMAQVNNVPKGTGTSPTPATPASVAWVIKDKMPPMDRYWHRKSKYAVVSWTRNTEKDLAGYRVEMAGSVNGPWHRVNRNPVAWWENHYTVLGLGVAKKSGGYSGHSECMHFRVIAIDEAGNESAASIPSAVSGCSTHEAPPLPHDLRASTNANPTGGSNCSTKLEWDPVPDAKYYYVYRRVMHEGFTFYQTQRVTATTASIQSYVESGDPETVINANDGVCNNGDASNDDHDCPYWCDDEGTIHGTCKIGFLDSFYVTAQYDPAVVGANPGESERSNVVYWNCELDPGYAKLQEAIQSTDAIAMATVPEESDQGVCSERPHDVLLFLRDEEAVAQSVSMFPSSALGGDTVSRLVGEGVPSEHSAALSPLVRFGVVDPNPPWKVYDLYTDHLGSVRVVANGGTVISQHDYFPFGEEIAPMLDFGTHMFTGHERDGETGLDYMMARYYGPSFARFITVDPVRRRRSSRSSQSWNAYAYSLSNPLRFSDPNGESPTVTYDANVPPEVRSMVGDYVSTPTMKAIPETFQLAVKVTVATPVGKGEKGDEVYMMGQTKPDVVKDPNTGKAAAKGATVEFATSAPGGQAVAVTKHTVGEEMGHVVDVSQNPDRYLEPSTTAEEHNAKEDTAHANRKQMDGELAAEEAERDEARKTLEQQNDPHITGGQ